MLFYMHFIADFIAKTNHLNPVQECLYRRLIDWSYLHECPLPAKWDRLEAITRCHADEHKKELRFVIEEFFVRQDDGYHQRRIDEELLRYANGSGNAQRQKKYRERRASIYRALRNAGVTPPYNASMEELRTLAISNRVDIPEISSVTAPTITNDVTVTVTGTAIVQIPESKKERENAREEEIPPPAITPTRAGQACKAMKRHGLSDVNPGDPRLHALLAAGVTDEELAIAAAEAVARRKAWPYALAIVKSRREEAESLRHLPPPARPGNGPPSAASEWVRVMTPSMVPKPPEAA